MSTLNTLTHLLDQHPEIAPDLADLTYALHADGTLTRAEIDRLHEHMLAASASFRAGPWESEPQAAQRLSNGLQNRRQNGKPLPVLGSGDARAELSRRHHQARRLSAVSANALDILTKYDPDCVKAVRAHIAALRDECAAARIYAREASEGRLS